LEWAVKMEKPFFVSQRSRLQTLLGERSSKKLYSGCRSGSGSAECHLVIDGNDIAGRVTSIAFSLLSITHQARLHR